MYAQELEVALAAVHAASTLCQSVQQHLVVDGLSKSDKSPVTVADFGSQALVCKTLREAFPNDPIIAEEDSAELRTEENAHLLEKVVTHLNDVREDVDAETACTWIDHGGAQEYSERFWTLDPIDGTKGFLRGEQYAIALALIVDGEIVVAALGCPNLSVSAGAEKTGVVYAAVKGQGTVAMSMDGSGEAVSVSVSDTTDSSLARFCESVESGHTSHSDSANVAEKLGITADSVRLDSQAKYAVVARGEADIYLRLPTRPGYVEKIWDHAAGVLVMTEAGGQASDIYGQPLEFNHGWGLHANKGVIVTNGKLHDLVIEAINEVGVTAA